MEVEQTIDITRAQQHIIDRLLQQFLPNTTVWIYGSRINGTARKNSDLDMVAFTNKQQQLAIEDLREAFDESDLPFRVDLFSWDEIPQQFHKNIQANYHILQKQTPQKPSTKRSGTQK